MAPHITVYSRVYSATPGEAGNTDVRKKTANEPVKEQFVISRTAQLTVVDQISMYFKPRGIISPTLRLDGHNNFLNLTLI